MLNLRKVAVATAAVMLISSQMMPAAKASVVHPPKVARVMHEKYVTVALSHLTVHTTKSGAVAALNSPQVKYFDAEAVAFLTVYAKGWSVKEWRCLQYVWSHESRFNPKARNSDTGAYGIAQFMPDTWGNYKVAKTDNAKLQIQYGLRYIEARYGSACAANAHFRSRNWY